MSLLNKKSPDLPEVPEDQRTPLVDKLPEIISFQNEQLQLQKEVIQGLKEKPKRPGSKKKRKKLKIHETVTVPPEHIPACSRFKGYEDYFVQDILIQPHNVRYRLERWITPSGESIAGTIPEGISQGHFGNHLIRYILYQYHNCLVTQPLLLEGLLKMDIDISSGKISQILIEGKESFHAEKEDILSAGLEVSDYVNVDDTGARHNG